MADALRVTAYLSSPLAGDPPQLDSLLTYALSPLLGKAAEPGYKVGRSRPCPDTSQIPIPVLRRRAGRWNVPTTSSPVLPEPVSDGVEYVCKRVAVERAGDLHPAERKVVTTTNDWTKSYRLPLRVRRVDRVVWFAAGSRREIVKLLNQIPAVGKKISVGYGRVARWEVERLQEGVPHEWWPWWWHSEGGPVLMRPLPADWPGLPAELVGAKPGFGACVDPYWHPERFTEVVVPC